MVESLIHILQVFRMIEGPALIHPLSVCVCVRVCSDTVAKNYDRDHACMFILLST